MKFTFCAHWYCLYGSKMIFQQLHQNIGTSLLNSAYKHFTPLKSQNSCIVSIKGAHDLFLTEFFQFLTNSYSDLVSDRPNDLVSFFCKV